MRKTTGPGTVYRARSADRHETVRHVSGASAALLLVVGIVVVAVLLAPSLLDWVRS